MPGTPIQLHASVLSHFEVPWLGPVAADELAVDELLLQDCTRVEGPDGIRHWAMNDAVRRSVVGGATRAELREALASVAHRPDDARQRAIDALLASDGLPNLEGAGVDQVRALESVARWLEPEGSEDAQRLLRNRLQLGELLDSLRAVASPEFTGRAAELQLLAGGLTGGNPATLIQGLGGVGKSALIAQHVLGVVPMGALFAYLNFDDLALDPRYPAGLVQAIARQLSLQLPPGLSEGAERVAERAGDRARTGKAALEVQTRGVQVRGSEVGDLLHTLHDLLPPHRPRVLALDTLEELQRRDRSAMFALADFLDAVAGMLPDVRILLGGRAPVPELQEPSRAVAVVTLELSGLARPEAIRLLGALYERDDVDLGEVVDQVGTTPLCLRLAAGILRRAPADDALRGLELHRVGIEGELYRRLLWQIPDEDVRRLAHPGLTLRRVTPDLIRTVLAEPCGVDVPDDARAWTLFEGLAGEAVLVERDPLDPQTLIHRADVRRMMLRRLSEDAASTVAEIHRAAVGYYAGRDDVTSRTEELYHRLMLGQDDALLDARWDERALPGLLSALEEMPPASRAYVAARAPDAGISDEDLAEAELETRRRLIHRRVGELVGEQRIPEAAETLRGYLEDTGDTDFSTRDLLVGVTELSGDFASAYATALDARGAALSSGSLAQYVAFSLHAARLSEKVDAGGSALAQLDEALAVTRSFEVTDGQRMLVLRLLVARLGLARRLGMGVDEAAADEAIGLYDTLGLRQIQRVPGLLRDLAAEIGTRSQRILDAALRTIGVAPEVVKRIDELTTHDDPAPAPPQWTDDLERGEAGRAVSSRLEDSDEHEAERISEAVSDYYAAESEAASAYTPEEPPDDAAADA